MTKRIFFLLPLMFLMLMAAINVKARTVVVLDNSAVASAFLPQQLVEIKELIAQMPDGESLTIVRAAPTSRTVFDGLLGGDTRLNLGATLATVRASKTGADLGAALAVATSLAAREGGAKRIIILTAGLSHPPRRSAFFGKSLDDLLKDSGLVPNDVRVIVRLYGESPLNTSRDNVRSIRSTPNWKNELASAGPAQPKGQPSEGAQGQPVPVRYRFGSWLLAGALTLATIAVFGIWAWRQKLARAEESRLKEEERRLLSSASSTPEKGNAPEKDRVVYSIDTGETELKLNDDEELLLGEHWDAAAFFQADGASVRLSADSGVLKVENAGSGSVSVGTLALQSGEARRLPARYIEITVGGHLVSISPEIVRAEDAAKESPVRPQLTARVEGLDGEEVLR
jgi:hypothetical protein